MRDFFLGGKGLLLKRAPGSLGPLGVFSAFYILGLVLFFGFRAALFFKYFPRVWEVEGSLLLFLVGLRVDTIVLCYVLLPLCILLMTLPQRMIVRLSRWLAGYGTLFMAGFVFLECATFPFMDEFDTRPDRLFIEHMVQVREVFGMIWVGYRQQLIIAVLAVMLMAVFTFRVFRALLTAVSPYSHGRRALPLLILLLLLVMGARSSLRGRPFNTQDAAFSESHLVNQLALNTSYSLAYDYLSQKKEEKDMGSKYGKMDPQEMLVRVQKTTLCSNETPAGSEIPLLYAHQPLRKAPAPFNLVIIIEESLGAEYVGCLGGLPLTPSLDRLSREGLLFTKLYATGTRTLRGIEAILSGFLPTPGKSVVKLGLTERNFFTIAGLLQRKGYITEVMYSGDANFDNMNAFCRNNGFQNIYDERSIENPVFKGNWGVSDEDLFAKALEIFKGHGSRPFFALILTTSHHDPFEFPDGRIELYEQPKMTRHNAIKYADHALGQFFERAKQESYYRNTLFLIIADHSTRLSGKDLIPIKKFHIPGLILGPGVSPGAYSSVASQIDMLPTLLDLMAIEATYPHAGRHLLQVPAGVPGRAVMQYGNVNCFMCADQVIVQRPKKKPRQFTYHQGRLLSADLDEELARDALAHALLPGYLYYNLLHRLPPESP
jgi:phosphoglycerol transferase MdoB-like AlkP superfamily enzyme